MARRTRVKLAIKKQLKLLRKDAMPLWKQFCETVYAAGYSVPEFTESICRQTMYDEPRYHHPSWVGVRIPYLATMLPFDSRGYKELYAFEDAVFRIIRRTKRPGRVEFFMYDVPARDIDYYVHETIQLFRDLEASRISELRIARLHLIPRFNTIMRMIRDGELCTASPTFTGIPYIDIKEIEHDLPGQTPE